MKPNLFGVIVVAIILLFSLFSVIKFAVVVEHNEKLISDAFKDAHFRDNLPILTVPRTLLRTAQDNHSLTASLRYPFIAAIISRRNTNSTNTTLTWNFKCFGGVILMNWIIAPAHCYKPDHSHRALLFYEYIRNYTRSHLIIQWIVHPGYDPESIMQEYDIALAKVEGNLEMALDTSVFSSIGVPQLQVSVWKTIMTMDRHTYLTSDLGAYIATTTDPARCYEMYGFYPQHQLCVNMSAYADCFVSEFGPLYTSERVAGVLAVGPKDCDNKMAVFTNVSAYGEWIMSYVRAKDDGGGFVH